LRSNPPNAPIEPRPPVRCDLLTIEHCRTVSFFKFIRPIPKISASGFAINVV